MDDCMHKQHEYYQLPPNLTTQNPSALSPNSTFRQYFIYFIVRIVNIRPVTVDVLINALMR